MDIEVEQRGAVTLLRINRPQAANTLTFEARAALEAALLAFEADAQARVAVLTGAGERHFCAGSDLRAAAAALPPMFDPSDRALLSDIERTKPLIAAVNGHAMGGGLELALLADIRLAADHATFGLTEAAIGSMPGSGGTQRLPRLVGTGHALLMLLAAERIGADEALRWGLVSRVVAGTALIDEALALAGRIAANAPLSLRAIRQAVVEGLAMPLAQGLAFERSLFARLRGTEDRAEGRAAFRDKRAPRFVGR